MRQWSKVAIGIVFTVGLKASADAIPHQYIVTFKSPAFAGAFRSPAGFKKLRQFERYVVLQAVGENEKEAVEKVKGMSGVESVQADQTVSLMSDVDVVSSSSTSNPAVACSLGKNCPEAGQDLDWDEQLSNIDLMNLEMNRLGVRPSGVRIALVDSGFDPQIANTMKDQGSVQWANNGKKADLTAVKHGTKMGERIFWAAPGTTVTSFPVIRDEKNKITGLMETTAAVSDILAAVHDACRTGNEIVNLSAAPKAAKSISTSEADAEAEETSAAGEPAPLETRFPHLPDDLCNQGCLLVLAAGNSPAHYDGGKILTVGALDRGGTPAEQYAIGRLMAGGVLATTYQTAAGVGRTPGSCGSSKGLDLVSGTSEATPLVSAIAKQTLSILKRSRRYASMKPCDRMQLLSKILDVSAVNKRADGYRAVMLAEKVDQDLDAGVKFVVVDQEYAEAAFTNMIPEHPGTNCRAFDKSKQGCDQRRACYLAKRRHLALEETDGDDLDDLQDLYLTAKESGNLTLMRSWESRLIDKGARSWLQSVGGGD